MTSWKPEANVMFKMNAFLAALTTATVLLTGVAMAASTDTQQAATVNPALTSTGPALGMKPNSADLHVNDIEIYEPDVLPADMQPVLRDEAARW
jgi:hypothetical protein